MSIEVNSALPVEIVPLLLVENEEDDAIITRALLSDIRGTTFKIDWVETYEAGLNSMIENLHHICVLDHCLGKRTGIELLQAARERGSHIPVVMLTGNLDPTIQGNATTIGVRSFLIKGQTDAALLEQAIHQAREETLRLEVRR